MATKRSAETQCRHYRRLLQNALIGFRIALDPACSEGAKRGYAEDMVRMIREELDRASRVRKPADRKGER